MNPCKDCQCDTCYNDCYNCSSCTIGHRIKTTNCKDYEERIKEIEEDFEEAYENQRDKF